MRKVLLVIQIMFIGFISSISLQAQIRIDLSNKGTVTESIDIKNLEPIIIIENRIPSGIYSITIEKEEIEIPPFNYPAEMKDFTDKSMGTEIIEKCNEAIKKLKDEKDESNIPDLIKELKKIIQSKEFKEDTTYNKDSLRKSALLLIDNTKSIKELGFDFRNNQIITIKITRNDTNLTWTRIYKTPVKSPWKIMYGFTFVPNFVSKQDNYYTKAIGETNPKFSILKLNKNSNIDFWENISPTIMFQLAPTKKYSKGCGLLYSNYFYQIGFAGGLSLNFAKETGLVNVMVGPSIVFADNLSISVGITFVQRDVLKGEYKANDVVKENLDFSQLHDKKYFPELFLSLSFRFDKNPFSSEDK